MNVHTQNGSRELEVLLDFLKRNRGFDFTGYKRTSLARRIQKRMQTVGIQEYGDYLDFLEVHPDEFANLFNTILINVTSFFREPEAWSYLGENILPSIIANKSPSEAIRVWCAGNASGEEAYTIAMLMAEAIGEPAAQERVKIYATDLDEDALSKARLAVYSQEEVEPVSSELLTRYFEPVGSQYAFRKDLRRILIFGRHDIIQDAPISRIDLLICRNLLMYFNAETQVWVLNRLHFALKNNGYLFLGKAEMLLTHANLFTPVDLKHRIFAKVSKPNFRERTLAMAASNSDQSITMLTSMMQLREAAFDTVPEAQIAVDVNGMLALANQRARSLFALSSRHIGYPFRDLELSYRPVELRSPIDNVITNRSPISLGEVEWREANGNSFFLDVQLAPLEDHDGAVIGVSVSFNDVTHYKHLHQKLEHSNQELETAMEELQSTNEELETTNEELQSTIEELETMNEELQSTNEELETMNKELQSTNQEMETINDELRQRNVAFDQVNAFMDTIFSSIHGGVVVLDPELRILVWNNESEDLWGLREGEILGQNFYSLDIGLPVEKLRKPVSACLADGTEHQRLVVEARNRRSRVFNCRVTCSTLKDRDKGIIGVILVAEEIESGS